MFSFNTYVNIQLHSFTKGKFYFHVKFSFSSLFLYFSSSSYICLTNLYYKSMKYDLSLVNSKFHYSGTIQKWLEYTKNDNYVN